MYINISPNLEDDISALLVSYCTSLLLSLPHSAIVETFADVSS